MSADPYIVTEFCLVFLDLIFFGDPYCCVAISFFKLLLFGVFRLETFLSCNTLFSFVVVTVVVLVVVVVFVAIRIDTSFDMVE